MGRRHVRRIAQLGVPFDRQRHQVGEREQAFGRLDVLRIDPELAGNPELQVLGHVGAHLQTDDAGELARGELGGDHAEQGTRSEVGLLVALDVDPWIALRAARHAEEGAPDLRCFREERRQAERDHLLEWHDRRAPGQLRPA